MGVVIVSLVLVELVYI